MGKNKNKKNRKKTKTSKEVHQRRNVDKVVKDKFGAIDHIWAEDGVVKTLLKNGDQRNLTVKEAATRAAHLNAMLGNMSEWHKRSTHELITKIVEVCREAQYQLEAPKDAKAREMNNLLQGKTHDGRTHAEVMSKFSPAVQQAMKYSAQFPHLEINEIEAVMREQSLNMAAKMRILAEEEHARTMKAFEEEAARVSASQTP